ncbi:MAG: hypothetical protein ACTJH9_04035 [Pseudoalteromonas sp.]|uniref:hypothetical protein n=1 Tax=Pseudoalteromonas TaxID=53246 RepID=UPI003F972D05
MKKNTLGIFVAVPLMMASYTSTATEVPEQSYFENRCMAAWESIKAGDKQALFDQLPPKLQNWKEGKAAWEEIDRELKDYESDWTESMLDDLDITMMPTYGRGPDGTETKTGIRQSINKNIVAYYPKATRQYSVLYEFKTGSSVIGKSCAFLELDGKWYMHHTFL